MIKIDTKDVNEKDFQADVEITGSGKEIIRDFYYLHDVLMKNKSIALLYGIAIEKWEKEHEDN